MRNRYATRTKYQPYIDVIMDDLNIPRDINVKFEFTSCGRRYGGRAFYNKELNWGYVKLSKYFSHIWTLSSIMHEYMHIQQYYEGRLKGRGDSAEWMGKEMKIYAPSRKAEKDEYNNSPWEIEARAYEDEVDRLFPKGVIQNRKHVATVNGTKFYKVIQ